MSDVSMTRPAPTGGTFSVGGCLKRTLSTFFANFISLNVLGLIIMVPGVILLVLLFRSTFLAIMTYDPATATTPPDFGGTAALAIFGAAILFIALQYLLTGSVVYGTLQYLDGQKPSLFGSLAQGLRRIVPIIIVAIITMILVWLGMILFVVPGIIIALMLCVAIPVLMVEGPGVFASLSRSRALTKGSRWRLLGLFLVAVAGVILVTVVISTAADLFLLLLGDAGGMIGTLVELALQLFTTVFMAVLLAVTYHDLRVAKEGVSTGQLAAVFD